MLLLLPKEKLEVNLMLSFKALEEKKKTNIKINPKKNDLLEKQKKHPEDCPGCEKCEDEKEEKVVEGTAYGLYKGDGKPKGVYDLKKKKKEKKEEEIISKLDTINLRKINAVCNKKIKELTDENERMKDYNENVVLPGVKQFQDSTNEKNRVGITTRGIILHILPTEPSTKSIGENVAIVVRTAKITGIPTS